MATVIGHHPAYQMGACYGGPFEISEYEIIGGYLQEPLRLVPSETWGTRLLVPADAEIVIEGALLPQAHGRRTLRGSQRLSGPPRFSAIRMLRGARHHAGAVARCTRRFSHQKATSLGWIWLAKARICDVAERRCPACRPFVPAAGMRLLNVFIAMKKMSEGDPGRAAAAALTWDWAKNVFVFDDDIDVYNPTEILWALATRVQPLLADFNHSRHHSEGSLIDPSMTDPRQDFRL